MAENIQQDTLQKQNLASIDSNYLKLRLDTQDLNKYIKNFLSGKEFITYFDDARNEWVDEVISEGEPLANAQGIQMICSTIKMLVNPHTIQGNTEKAEFKIFMYNVYKDLLEGIVLNYQKWGIDPDNRGFILESIDNMLHLILSRTIDNKEREGLTVGVEKTSNYYENKEKKRGLF